MSRIVLDLRMVRGAWHGISRYAVELLQRLPALLPEHELFALVAGEGPQLPEGVRAVRCRFAFLDPREQLELPFVLERIAPDLVHWTSFSATALSARPCVITLHDANHLALPENFGPLHGLYYRAVVKPVAQRARKVITVSRFSAAELERHLALPSEKIAVIPNGVDPRFQPPSVEAVAALRERLGLPEKFVLYVGAQKPHKNVATLVAAAERARLPLVMVSSRGEGELPASVRLLSGLDDAELPTLYGAATCFAFPSIYEGFGLPPLEAVACGTPTLIADAASLPEVLGPAAERLPPMDVSAWAAALRRVAEATPERTGEAGRSWAARFTWERAARETAEVYRAALAATRGDSSTSGDDGASGS